jgi:hypothetical protein
MLQLKFTLDQRLHLGGSLPVRQWNLSCKISVTQLRMQHGTTMRKGTEGGVAKQALLVMMQTECVVRI